VYDADSHTYSAVDITTTAFSIMVDESTIQVPAHHYVNAGSFSAPSYLAAGGAGDASSFAMIFAQPLTNAGGTVGFLPQAQINPPEFYISAETVSVPPLQIRPITQGTVVGVPVPPPVPALSPLALLILSLLLAGCGVKLAIRAERGTAGSRA
jgi:hypothetical protein